MSTIPCCKAAQNVVHIGALVGAIGALPLAAAVAQTAPELGPPHTVQHESSKTNELGCVETSIPDKQSGHFVEAYRLFYTRPAGLEVERRSDSELLSCGLPPRLGAKTNSPEYREWLSIVKSELKEKPLTPFQMHQLVETKTVSPMRAQGTPPPH